MRTVLYAVSLLAALTSIANSAPLSEADLENLFAGIRQNRSTQADFQEERVIRLMKKPIHLTQLFCRVASASCETRLSSFSSRRFGPNFSAIPKPNRSLWSASVLSLVFLQFLSRRLLFFDHFHERFPVVVAILFRIPFRAHTVD